MKVVSWNCKGLGNENKEEALKDPLKIEKLDVILNQETKMEEKEALQVGKKQ